MIRFALHGGAGDALPDDQAPGSHRSILREIAEEARQALAQGAAALDVVTLAVQRMEDCPLFNAGIGAVLNHDGQPEMDAAVMVGDARRCGGVTGISRSRSPVRLARAVMEQSPHVLMGGAGAEALGRGLGLAEVTPDFFVTEERFRQLKEAHARGVITLDHDHAATEKSSNPFGTVGAVALDAAGCLAAATSTGGMTNKHPGRIGDTPLPGVGTFADNASLAVSCTGTGEAFIRAGFGLEAHARMQYAGDDVLSACTAALDKARGYGGRGGCIAIGHDGKVALPFNSRLMYRAWFDADDVVHVAIGADDAD